MQGFVLVAGSVLGLNDHVVGRRGLARSMTLARKGTRKLVLDDVEYRWTVAPDDEPGIAIVVELATAPACWLVSWVEHGATVSPGVVRSAILDALDAGWIPSERGQDFVRRVPRLGFPC